MSRQLVQRCTTMMPWRQSIFSPQVRTATRPGQQRQLTAAADRTIATSPAASAPIDYHARFSQQRGIHSYRPLNTTPVNSSMSLPSVRCFSTDDKEDKKDEGKKEKSEEKKEATKESTEKKEATKESKEKESVAAADEDAAETSKDGAAADADPAAAAPAAKAEEEDDCPPWMNPLHHADKSPSKEFREDLEPGEELKVLPAAPLADPNNPDKVLASQEVYDLADEIVNLSMLEMKELITKIGDHFGFEEPPFRGSDGSGGGDDGGGEDEDAPAAEVKTQFDVKLESYDAKSKIKVIKEVRAVAGLGLKEAKELVEGAPKVVMKDVSKDTAEELKEKLEAVGAVIEIV